MTTNPHILASAPLQLSGSGSAASNLCIASSSSWRSSSQSTDWILPMKGGSILFRWLSCWWPIFGMRSCRKKRILRSFLKKYWGFMCMNSIRRSMELTCSEPTIDLFSTKKTNTNKTTQKWWKLIYRLETLSARAKTWPETVINTVVSGTCSVWYWVADSKGETVSYSRCCKRSKKESWKNWLRSGSGREMCLSTCTNRWNIVFDFYIIFLIKIFKFATKYLHPTTEASWGGYQYQ